MLAQGHGTNLSQASRSIRIFAAFFLAAITLRLRFTLGFS
jgi:hypothetical protein